MIGTVELIVWLSLVSISLQRDALKMSWGSSTDTADRVRANGYPCEKHKVTTEDGYILTVYRIPHGKVGSNSTSSRPPVIVQHGILCTSDCWIVNDPRNGLGYVLADSGFDVWLTNARGTTYSRKHVNMSSNSDRYWNFSIHEMGLYDLPAVIDDILNRTGRETLSFVGHSQGTSVFYVMASLLPDYANKINVACTLAPVVYLDSTRGAIQALGRVSAFLEKLADFFKIKYVLDHNAIIQELDHLVCRIPIVYNVCEDIVFLAAGFDSPMLDKKVLAKVGEFCPSGASMKDLKHFGQLLRNGKPLDSPDSQNRLNNWIKIQGGKFAMYDYGKDNYKHYNSTEPPEYPLGNIKTPVALLYSCNDFISSCPEVRRLSKNLTKVVEMYQVPFKQFNHVDFMWATNAREVLYPKLIQVLRDYN